MSQFGKDMKIYADNGLRSTAGWLTLGRQVASGSKPRTNFTSGSEVIELFTRDQTEVRVRAQQAQ